MPFNYASLQTAMQEVGRPLFFEQANLEAPIVDFNMKQGAEKKRFKVFTKKSEPRSVISVTVKKGGYDSTRWAPDGGARPQASQLDHAIGKMGFCLVTGNIFFPEGITRVASGGEGIDMFKSAIESSGADFGRTLDRSHLDHRLGDASANAVLGATTLAVRDASGYQPGQTVDQFDSTGVTRAGSFVVSDVVINADGTGTLTMRVPGLPAAVTADSTRFYLAGSGGAAAPGVAGRNAMTNLGDFCNAAISCFSNLVAADQPAGFLDSTTTTLTNTKMKDAATMVRTRSSQTVDYIVVHPINETRIFNNQNPQLRFQENQTLDVYGNPMIAFDKATVVPDTNQGVRVVDFITASEQCAYLHEFWGVQPKKGWTKEALRESDAYIGDNLFVSGGYNLVPRRRNAFARMNAITG